MTRKKIAALTPPLLHTRTPAIHFFSHNSYTHLLRGLPWPEAADHSYYIEWAHNYQTFQKIFVSESPNKIQLILTAVAILDQNRDREDFSQDPLYFGVSVKVCQGKERSSLFLLTMLPYLACTAIGWLPQKEAHAQ